MRAPIPLIVRGGLSRTFGSLAGFTALALLSLGVYLLADAFAHPVDAEAAGVIVAALAIAIAMLLFFFLFEPRRFPEMLRRKKPERIAQQRADAPAKLHATAPRDRVRNDLPYHRTFVDRSCIRPRTPSPVQARGIAGK
jgi:hypothetical protein